MLLEHETARRRTSFLSTWLGLVFWLVASLAGCKLGLAIISIYLRPVQSPPPPIGTVVLDVRGVEVSCNVRGPGWICVPAQIMTLQLQ